MIIHIHTHPFGIIISFLFIRFLYTISSTFAPIFHICAAHTTPPIYPTLHAYNTYRDRERRWQSRFPLFVSLSLSLFISVFLFHMSLRSDFALLLLLLQLLLLLLSALLLRRCAVSGGKARLSINPFSLPHLHQTTLRLMQLLLLACCCSSSAALSRRQARATGTSP